MERLFLLPWQPESCGRRSHARCRHALRLLGRATRALKECGEQVHYVKVEQRSGAAWHHREIRAR